MATYYNRLYNEQTSILSASLSGCVLIGFDEEGLKILLVEKTHVESGHTGAISKLPGDLIYEDEELDAAAAASFLT